METKILQENFIADTQEKCRSVINAFHIVVEQRESVYTQINALLHDFSAFILLRVGLPIPEAHISVIYLVVKAPVEKMGALSGRLGQLQGVKLKVVQLKK